MAFNVKLTKIEVKQASPSAAFPYDMTIYGVDTDTDELRSYTATNAGLTPSVTDFVDVVIDLATWEVQNL